MTEILKSKLLSGVNGLVHGISTRAGGSAPYYNNLSRHVGDDESAVAENRARFFGGLGIDESRLVHANQVHSDGVTIVTKPGLYKKTDALITQKEDLYLVISVADCLPVMIFDPVRSVIANIHSGWRGTQKGIVTDTISMMQSEFSSSPGDMLVFIGPGISHEYFEVGGEVARMFDDKYISFRDSGTSAKPFIDIGAVVMDQLKSAGVKLENIERLELCTFSNADYLHSYRRDKENSGRMFAVVGKVKGQKQKNL
ncbi:MAG: peptidoglycan editing factor PgeF [Ignavibacteria bacterium]|nr:peptidoglycan editing factor PgeF [Ignavibacteria bacterium]